MNKKALTPLISTIILLAFAVGLGTLVMSWGQSELAESTCQDAVFSLTTLEDQEQICVSDTSLDLTLENNGIGTFRGIKAILLTDSETLELTSEKVIPAGGITRFSLEKNLEGRTVQKIRILPLSGEGICPSARIEVEQIRTC